jgi:hypothetical protein
VLLGFGLAASMVGLVRLAIAGFAPGGHLPALALAACAAGLVATLLTGRAPPASAEPQALRPELPRQPPKGPELPKAA